MDREQIARQTFPPGSTAVTGVKGKWWVLLAVGVGTFMTALDGSVANIVLPTVSRAFNTDVATVEWVVTIYLLVISVEAGLGLNAALLRVGQDMAVRCKPISEEFGRVNQELRTGVSREKALRNLSQRNRVEDLKIFVGALVLTDRLGTSIADTLRVQADSLRTRLRQKAEEQAAKAGIKMLFPLVFFILPALIIILMGPAVISVLRTFNK